MEPALVLVLSVVFWGSVFLIGHNYVVYPAVLAFLGRGKSLPRERFETDEEFPEVAVLMAVYNEEAVLRRTLETMLASDYPAGKLKIFVGSDGSTDRSHEIVESFQANHPELSLSVFHGRNGKIRIVNQLAIAARVSFGEPESAAFVLCDANVAWTPGMLRNLVRHFDRDDVSLVGSNVVDASRRHEGIAEEEEAYVERENRVKYYEGLLWGNTMGAFGACYAMRASLFRPVPENFVVDDFFLTMKCIEAGQKAIVDPEAVCHEAVSTDIREEFRRKKRIAAGNYQNMHYFRKLYRPWSGGWANWFAFWSHKGLRWLGPMLLLAAMASCLALSFLSPIYLVPLATFAISFAAAGLDWILAKCRPGLHVKSLRYVRYFYSMNAALLLGFFSYARGVRGSVWEPTRRVQSDAVLAERQRVVES
ncbi:MAG: glycosyltransferase [Verrucomicrobiales bacterium]